MKINIFRILLIFVSIINILINAQMCISGEMSYYYSYIMLPVTIITIICVICILCEKRND